MKQDKNIIWEFQDEEILEESINEISYPQVNVDITDDELIRIINKSFQKYMGKDFQNGNI